MSFRFELHQTDGLARRSTFHTPHGAIEMPAFAPVGTQANVKTLEPRDLYEAGAQLILANTYHLYLRPGHELIQRFGGLHAFMGWERPILTDSGGYQVFSLAESRKLKEDGVLFRSHIDGSLHHFTPEKVMEIEQALGPDIAMVLDECPPPLDRAYNEEALARTHRWAERCKAAHHRPDQALFGIVQGGVFEDLRLQSVEFLRQLDFPGYAIGGLAVGETKQAMYATLDFTCPALPADKPRYLMGVGAPEDIVEAVARGVDFFDCVLPTRIARNGQLLTPDGRMNMRNAQYAEDQRPVQADCTCYTCRTFSRAYLRHLYKAGEISALRLGTIHNVHFMLELMRQIRDAIAEERFGAFRADFLARFRITDQATRHAQRELRAAARAQGS
ncbi:MAG TPA: tRNA guanosine(34) transglycosylase Tgt [Chloroflexi bacterium]|nr:tRNA guanosine(34) transglycosylase Tgt [Chloroflexota bacterium]HHW86611.1 tRNA guanosine(34) transglycosylase Tgt [Chloroflexota bacterium]